MTVVGIRRGRKVTVRQAKALVTGAASGIGQATAVALAKQGGQLVLTDIDSPGLTATADLVRAAGGTVLAARALDITDYDAVRAFADAVHAEHVALDIVLNIAGTSAWGTVENLEHKHWRRMVEVNLMGPIHVIETFVPPMVRAGRGGALVNVSSAAGLIALPWHAAYSASKFGIRGVSEVLRFDLAPHGISVHVVAPGAVNTPLVHSFDLVGVDKDDPRVRRLHDRFTGHAVAPEKVADAIVKGIEKDRFLVFTSFDIRFAYWWKRKFALPYEFVIGQASKKFARLLREPRR
ncbi:SDR family oxidoreductase [Nocardia asteroides]|nr:SDR family oxidoreductase [Nocardia asteroides]UGT64399.1 SDR family oxidoreductase [Nocardia asteroides]